MKTYFISVIIPAYNVENYIGECIESILCQNYPYLEIVIVNDGSTDNTEEVCRNYEKSDSRIVVINQVNKGVSAARNMGMQKCHGEWIMFVDADDWIDHDTIKYSIKIMETNKTDMIAFPLVDTGKQQGLNGTIKEFNVTDHRSEMLGYCIVSPQEWPNLFSEEMVTNMNLNGPVAKFYKTEIIKKNNLSFNEKLSIAEDQDFNLQYVSNIQSITYINNPIYHVRIRRNSASRTFDGILEKHRNANIELCNRIESLGVRQFIIDYWQAHLIEELMIITRILNDNKYPFFNFMNEIREIKKFIKNNYIRESIRQFSKKKITPRTKRLIVMFYGWNLVYTTNIIYRLMRMKRKN